MRQLLFSAHARDDLLQIARYIARDNPVRAKSFVGELRVQCSQLITQPLLGISRDDYAKGVRMISHGRYLIFYSSAANEVHIERVLHSARDIGRLFESSSVDH
ncbi:type II toxin-antitoxin system RelE/ParE family toxin [Pseudomonas sp. B21-053]|jgi:toxin ParE1/3/4|uniref:type II toxin-antitoxin system RelE/ParE family toxin n=1 Tax=Pseudomonas sp. B21-053 TaxID=2895493 RepID=UPI002230D9F7|nr:type II toxin-antitoxin system RelE/ParE family toxin [Pseudomonas sp. B21-053]UZE12206.1 type II toxin-antitoxin system RelE/ParE family toxin [Pseudomonas sp. B21-053]